MEFVSINSSEKKYGKNNILYTELGILEIKKRKKRYWEFRKEKKALKELLEKKTAELKKSISLLKKTFPKFEENISEIEKSEKRNDLDLEIEKIRKRIDEIQYN
ncbi:hypothetical protein CXX78_00280 [Candidatus Parvarchaeota archaeon]|jgi:biopolymer transport protein ExbB/TolQ|nr:MAG: hypothetical protein CXX78_01265 [Candidatus Parvarchaeota archaeon]PXY71574.1 MAG: hypothetical protein CXX78_00280 [Candidatus Parvarchaeota archaeon]